MKKKYFRSLSTISQGYVRAFINIEPKQTPLYMKKSQLSNLVRSGWLIKSGSTYKVTKSGIEAYERWKGVARGLTIRKSR